MPLSHPPGHAQCDFGEALVVIGGVERKAHCFVIDLPHSDGCFVKAYPAETSEAFLDGHVAASDFLGGVPRSILYDNTRLAVAKILGDGRRQRTRACTELQSHYLFEDRFGRPGKGNDKGKVEGLVGYMRRNFLVPVPSFESFDALSNYLKKRFEIVVNGVRVVARIVPRDGWRWISATQLRTTWNRCRSWMRKRATSGGCWKALSFGCEAVASGTICPRSWETIAPSIGPSSVGWGVECWRASGLPWWMRGTGRSGPGLLHG